jgi:hypothetical protein
MKAKIKIVTAVLALAAGLAFPLAAQGHDSPAQARLDALVDRAIDEGGPFFTPAERAVIERACGYPPGSWNGFQVNMIGNVFHCTNGRRVSSPEVRAVMAAASPRIDAHVDAVFDRPEIVAAMEQVERESASEAWRRRR